MNEISVSRAQFSKIQRLADSCNTFRISDGRLEFNEKRWLNGMKEILGYLPPPGTYKAVVSDSMVVEFKSAK